MKTIAIIIAYFFLCTPIRFIGALVMKVAGLPGSLVAYKSTSQKQPKYILGVLICFIAHLYTYLAIIIYIINWTRHLMHPDSFSKYLVWFFCMILVTVTIEGIYRTAKNEPVKNESLNKPHYLNPQIASLYATRIFVFVGFWIFIFIPEVTNPLWRWVNDIGFLI